MPYPETNKLISGIYCLFNDNLTCLKTWGFYLFDDEFKTEPELRNKLGAIWLASLFDSLHAETGQLRKYEAEIDRLSLLHLKRYCLQASYFFDCIKQLISIYSKEEQIFIIYLRNQWVHSFLKGRHAENVTIKFVDSGTLKTESITQEQYSDIVRPLFKKGALDKTLNELMRRFRDENLAYWVVIKELMDSATLMYDAMQNGKEYELKSIPI